MTTFKEDLSEALHSLYEDILISEEYLQANDRKASLETAEQALDQATNAIIEAVEKMLPEKMTLIAHADYRAKGWNDYYDTIKEAIRGKSV